MGGEGFGPHDLSLSVATLQKAYEMGFRHFDTAGFYAQGRSEELIKKVFFKRRKKVFISTKGGLWRHGRKVWHDASPNALRRSLEESLSRLQTDYIDLFQLHWPDPKIPITESLGAITKFKEEGLVRFVGAGNLSSSQIERYIMPGDCMPLQTHYNPIHIDGLEVLRAGRKEDRCINCVISPFEQGLLASSQLVKQSLGKKDVRNRNPYFRDQGVKDRVLRFFEGCEAEGVEPVVKVLRWLFSHKEVDIVIPGPRRPEQLDKILEGIQS